MTSEFHLALVPKEQMTEILPLVQMLNNNTIPLSILKERLEEMLLNKYQCLGVYENDMLIGICGLWILNKFYLGKHLEVDNVFVLPNYRSFGIGKMMLDWVFNYAKSIGCVASEVNCYIHNEKGVKFWKNQGYNAIGYHLQKVL